MEYYGVNIKTRVTKLAMNYNEYNYYIITK